jgi:predicted flavoprotein YhiN
VLRERLIRPRTLAEAISTAGGIAAKALDEHLSLVIGISRLNL